MLTKGNWNKETREESIMSDLYKQALEIEVLQEVIAGVVARQFHKEHKNPSKYNKMLLKQLEQAQEVDLFNCSMQDLKELQDYWKIMSELTLKS